MEGWDNDECFSNYTELHRRIAPKMFFKKCQSQPLFNLFSSFHTNITTKYMWKNVHPWDSNTGLSGPQPPPITTRPGLPPQKMFYNTFPKLFCRRRASLIDNCEWQEWQKRWAEGGPLTNTERERIRKKAFSSGFLLSLLPLGHKLRRKYCKTSSSCQWCSDFVRNLTIIYLHSSFLASFCKWAISGLYSVYLFLYFSNNKAALFRIDLHIRRDKGIS